MLLRQVLEIVDLVDRPDASGEAVARLLVARGAGDVTVRRVEGVQRPDGSRHGTDFVRILVPGESGKTAGGEAPTLGIIGRLGGVGSRPAAIGMVSDADGGVAAMAAALKLVEMAAAGDRLPGDVIVATHVCPSAPTLPHDPVPFQGSPVDMAAMNRYEVDPAMDAILSIDTTKGNRILNIKGIAITPTVKEGWILRVSEDLLGLLEQVTGRPPAVLPVTMQDITPYGNDIFHVNSILQPATATAAPVVGLAITAETAVAGCGTGASHPADVEMAARFAVEAAKVLTAGRCRLYDPAEFARLLELYGSMLRLQA